MDLEYVYSFRTAQKMLQVENAVDAFLARQAIGGCCHFPSQLVCLGMIPHLPFCKDRRAFIFCQKFVNEKFAQKSLSVKKIDRTNAGRQYGWRRQVRFCQPRWHALRCLRLPHV